MDYRQQKIIRDLVEVLEYAVRNHYEVSPRDIHILAQLKEIQEIEQTQISHIWTVEDVLDKAEELGLTLTEEQAVDVLRNVEAEIDCEVGVTWDVIETHVKWYAEELELVNQML